ncbi:sugar-binding protein [Galbibacter mesophilus]|uniref:sugar-binding protein n=1 Tax=Galbibacter mesophilus TaxID=379069 RepID=UPI00191D0F6C|nr:sugar-binding protein [Galbibacter mesophilus]MCM5663047.1 fibronectin type III domain-containing protein [Galbibacter mesophilus]
MKTIFNKKNLFWLFAMGFLMMANAQTQGYQYVRLIIKQNTAGVHIHEIEWLNGDIIYPKLPINSSSGSIEATFEGGHKHPEFFDKKVDETQYLGGSTAGLDTIALNFKDHVIYPTGIRIKKPSWSELYEFSVEGTNNPATGWTTLFNSQPNLTSADFETAFDFGFAPVTVDNTPPSSPNPTASEITHNSIEVSWPAVNDNSGQISGYQVFFDGVNAGFTSSTSFTKTLLEPSTSYDIEVIAYDAEYNASPKTAISVTTSEPAVAQGYTYVRFWLDETATGANQQIKEIRWLMGDKSFPLNPITAAAGDSEIEILSSNDNIYAFDGPYKAFDNDANTHWYAPEGKEVTLRFKNFTFYPTGITITENSWTNLKAFRCEGSVDGQNWTLLYERESVSGNEFESHQDNDRLKTGRFDFGTVTPPDLDTTPPSIPENITADETTATYAEISWSPSIDDGIGLASYNIFVNGKDWTVTNEENAIVYGLSPQTTYSITILAKDKLGNESEISAPFDVTTQTLQPAVGAMAIGAGLGHETHGVYKNNVDFAAEWANYGSANPFSQVFLDEISHYKVLRFMDMLSTNNNWIENWSDRRQPDDPNQTIKPNYNKNNIVVIKGMAIEWMIKMCNIVQADFWINVPHAANDNYIAELAALVKQHLDPNLKVYIEYSNEVWGGFAAEAYANDMGTNLGFGTGDFPRHAWFDDLDYARFRYYVHRASQIWNIFNSVYVSESSRVVKVLSGWAGQPALTRVHLDALSDDQVNPTGIYPDKYAIAPYFGGNLNGSDPEIESKIIEAAKNAGNMVAQHYTILAESGLNIPLIAYEAGQHITNSGELASRNPAMYEAYIQYLNANAPYMELLPQFVHFNPFGRGMAWGSKEYVGQPELEAYKYRALKDWQEVNKNNSEIVAPYITKQPESVVVAEGSGANFKVTAIGEQPMQFQWFENDEALTGENGSELLIQQNGLEKDGNVYKVEVSNSSGTVISESVTLTVTEVDKVLANKTNTPILIDATIEDSWNASEVISMDKVPLGTVSDSTDLDATFRLLWDEDYLYILVNVMDNELVPVEDPSKIWNYDGIEIYIDATNDKTDSYNTNDRQIVYTYNASSLVGASGTMSIENALAAQSTTSNGYQAEIALSWSDMGINPSDGHYIGLDVMIADNDTPGGNRKGKLSWWSEQDLNWQNPSLLGTALLSDEVNSNPTTVVDFEELTTGDYGSTEYIHDSGFKFKDIGPGNNNFLVYGTTNGFSSNVLQSKNWGRIIRITHTSGNTFDLESLDYAAGLWSGIGDATVTGYKADGCTVTTTYNFDKKQLTTLSLEWKDLTQVDIDFKGGTSNAYGVIDNLILTENSSGNNVTPVNVQTSVKLQQNKTAGNVSLYPNPSSEYVTISHTGNYAKVAVWNLMGLTVKKFPINGSSSTISTADLIPGIYMINVALDTGEVIQKKLIVE